jgi:hypothetical protein
MGIFPTKATQHPSPGGQYVALVGPAQEVAGNYLATIALWAVASPPRLLYYRAGYVAHSLHVHQTDQPAFLYWSQGGDWLTFYEFKRQHTYQVVFIHAATGRVFRVPATDELFSQLPTLSQHSPQIAAYLQQAQPSVGPLVLDNPPAELRLG